MKSSSSTTEQWTHRPIHELIMLMLALAAGLVVSLAIRAEGTEPDSAANTPQGFLEGLDRSTPYQPAGAPADPQVEARWNFYHDYTQATELLQALVEAHPERCKLESVGKSYGGREMWVMTITDYESLGEDDLFHRPAFWIDGGIHANELQGVDTVLYTAWYLCEMFDRNSALQNLLTERVFYLMPMMSPDSRDEHMYRPNTTHSPRSGQRPYDDDRDGLFEEDDVDDLNQDGHITQMRRRDPLGRYKEHPDFPQLLIPCDADEVGQFTLLGSEGIDNDGDGRVNEDGPGYYDPNRDWAWQWQPRYVQSGAYRYPFSILENRMVADFVMDRSHIAGAQSYHNTGGMILRGPGVKGEAWPSSDIAVYDKLGQRGEAMLPGYRYLHTADDLYEVFGGAHDWFYGMRGVFAFTNELNTPFNLFRKQVEGGYFGQQEDFQQFDDWLLLGDGFVDWVEIDHPQYGKIEVGGRKKNWGRQPPSFMLEEECHRNMAFTLFHASEMPQVEIVELEQQERSTNFREITATLINNNLIPTRSAFDVQKGITPPDLAILSGDDIKILTALQSQSPFFEEAVEQPHNPAEVTISALTSRNPIYIRWIVSGEGDVEVTLKSVKGGVATKKLSGDESEDES